MVGLSNMSTHFLGQSPVPTPTSSLDDGVFDRYGMTTIEVISLTVLSSGISVIGTISNILVIVTVLLNRQLRETCTAILLANLSFFDLLICAVFEPMYVYDIHCGSSATFEPVRNKFGLALFLGSLNSAFAASMDRFVSVCFPYHYVEWMTGKLTSIVVFSTWFITMTLTAMSIPINPPLYSFFYIAVIVVLIILSHIAMYWVARREANQINRLYPPECHTGTHWNKSAVVVAMVMASTLACWSPILILPAIISPSSPKFLRFIKITLAFTSLSSVINPFIFCWRLADFRKALCEVLRKANGAIHPNKCRAVHSPAVP